MFRRRRARTLALVAERAAAESTQGVRSPAVGEKAMALFVIVGKNEPVYEAELGGGTKVRTSMVLP